jgi:cardiolipin synthase
MPRVEFIQGNDLHLLRSGAEYFPALLQAINEARNEIFLETYIFQPDETGFRIQQALIQAARRGVSVRVVIDWLGSGREHAEQLCLILLREGVACRLFNPWFRRGLARTHRKITVCDGQVAFVGGLNIIDDLISDDGSGIRLPFPRWDFALRILGPLVPVIHSEVDAQWRKAGAMDLRSRFGLLRSLRQEARLASQQTGLAALLVRDNLRNRSSIQKAFCRRLAGQNSVLCW